MTDIVKPFAYKIVDAVEVALTQITPDEGYDFVAGVMRGIKAGMVAVTNPFLSPQEVIDVMGTEQVPAVDISVEFYRGLHVGSLAAPYVLRAAAVNGDAS